MRNTQNVVKLSIYCLTFTILLTLGGCNKDEKTTDCGCDSQIIKTIPETANLIGEISFKRQLDPKDNYYNNKYWIGYSDSDCTNCHRMIICNEEILIGFEDLNSLPVGTTVKVKFSGHLKGVCENTFDIAENTYDHIVLTKIVRQ